MKMLEDRIRKDGIVREGNVLKVDSFLNHRIDVALSTQMGQAFYEAFKDERVDCILTVEASGIAVAITTAQAFGGIPVVFAKKCDHRNVGHDVYTAQVYSFTHQTMNTVRVSRKYLPAGARVLIIDDFLANGNAAKGIMDLVKQAGAELVGMGFIIEKAFQHGGDELRSQGIHVESLAIIESLDNCEIKIR